MIASAPAWAAIDQREVGDPVTNSTANPFVGPDPLGYRANIYGRSRERAELGDLLISERVVTLHSPSGAGKTSLIQAALRPDLETENFLVLPPLRVTSERGAQFSTNPFIGAALASLASAAGAPRDPSQPVEPTTTLKTAVRQWARLHAGSATNAELGGPAVDAEAARGVARHIVVIFDQFEEILTSAPTLHQARWEFFEQLGELLADPGVWALFALREEYLGALDPFAHFIPNRFEARYRLGLFDTANARAVIERTTEASARPFSPEQIELLLSKLAEASVDASAVVRRDSQRWATPIEPVLLQVVCRDYWRRHRANELVEPRVDQALRDFYETSVRAVADRTGTSEFELRSWTGQTLIKDNRRTVAVVASAADSVPDHDENRATIALAPALALAAAHLVRAEPRGDGFLFELSHDRLVAPIRASNQAWLRSRSVGSLQRGLWRWREDGSLPGLRVGLWLCLTGALAQLTRRGRLSAPEREFVGRVWREYWWYFLIAGVVLFVVLFEASVREQARRHEEAFGRLDEEIREVERARMDDQWVEGVLYAANELARERPSAKLHLWTLLGAMPRVEKTLYPDASLRYLAFDPTDANRLLMVGQDGGLDLWDIANPMSPRSVSLEGGVRAIRARFSPDGQWLAAVNENGGIYIGKSDADELTQRGAVAPPQPGEACEVGGNANVVFSPNLTWLAANSVSCALQIWSFNRETGAIDGPTASFRPPSAKWIGSLDISQDSRHVAIGGGEDGVIRVLRIDRDSPAAVTLTPVYTSTVVASFPITTLAFHPRDSLKLAAGTGNGGVWLWSNPEQSNAPRQLGRHRAYLWSLAWLPDGERLVTGSRDGALAIRTVGATPQVEEYPATTLTVRAVAASADGRYIASGGTRQQIMIWDARANVTTPSMRNLPTSHTGRVRSVAANADGTLLATGGADHRINVWRINRGAGQVDFAPASIVPGDGTCPAPAGAATVTATHHINMVAAVAFHPTDPRVFASADRGGVIQFWTVTEAGARCHPAWPPLTIPNDSPIHALAWRPGSGPPELMIGADVGLFAWRPDAGVVPVRFARGSTLGQVRPRSLAFTRRGERLALGDWSGRVAIGEVKPFEEGFMFAPKIAPTQHEQLVYALAFAPDDRLLASAGFDGSVRVWDPDSLEQRAIAARSAFEALAVNFSPDGKLLASASVGGQVDHWDVVRQRYIAALPGNHDLLGLTFVPNTNGFVIVGDRPTVRFLDLDPPNLLQTACQIANRDLTEAEWRRLTGGAIDYRRVCQPWLAPQ